MNHMLLFSLGLFLGLIQGLHAAINQFEAMDIMSRVHSEFAPELKSQNKVLLISPIWESWGTSAFVENKESEVEIKIMGGWLNLKALTRDDYLFILCHELGHALGGYPKDPTLPWASAEGQSDYFATAKCMKRILRNDPENILAEKMKLPKKIKEVCRSQFSLDDDYRLCLRLARTSERAGEILNIVWKEDEFLSLSHRDKSKVAETNFRYPPLIQCRVDSILAGALCKVDPMIPFSDTDELKGSCHKALGHTVGTRPLCWFKPSVN